MNFQELKNQEKINLKNEISELEKKLKNLRRQYIQRRNHLEMQRKKCSTIEKAPGKTDPLQTHMNQNLFRYQQDFFKYHDKFIKYERECNNKIFQMKQKLSNLNTSH